MILDIIKEKIGNISVSAGDKSYTLDMLKLRRVKLDMRERSCLFNFAFPVLPDDGLRDKILSVVREACPPYFKIRLKIDRDYLDLRGAQDLFVGFLSGFQALSAAISPKEQSFVVRKTVLRGAEAVGRNGKTCGVLPFCRKICRFCFWIYQL